MMDQEEIEFSGTIKEETVNVITDAKFVKKSSSRRPRPLTIFFENNLSLVAKVNAYLSKLIVEVPSPFPYTNSKMVPWNYNFNYMNKPVMANISSIRGITRSGRCYTPATVEATPSNPVKKPPKQMIGPKELLEGVNSKSL